MSMKKLHWGNGILIAITLFIIGILSMVSYFISLDFYLVNNNHYEEGVTYQEKIDSKMRTDSLEESVVILFDEERIAIKVLFPEEVMSNAQSGTINLYRPNDSTLDQKMDIEFSSGSTQIIPMERMNKGKWILTINWKMYDLDYTEEKTIII